MRLTHNLFEHAGPILGQLADALGLEQRAGELPSATQPLAVLVEEQGHVEFRVARQCWQYLDLEAIEAAVAHRQVVHHEQHLHQRIDAALTSDPGSFDDHVERQVLMLEGTQGSVTGNPQVMAEPLLRAITRTQRQDVDEEADQALQLRLLTAGNIGANQQVITVTDPVQQHLKGRQ
ncbi:hypothetical protein D3C79_827990 [compost metagenome]